jgi:flavin-dependent dehydrogenase
MLAPIGRQALQGMKSIASNKTVRHLAKEAAKRGTEVLAGVAVDALQGRNVGEALKERSREMALRAITGEGNKQVKKRKKQFKQSRKRPTKSHSQPPNKRRRLSRAALNRKSLF